MRNTLLLTLVLATVGLSGCSQLSSLLKGKSDKTLVADQDVLRSTPEQEYSFGEGDYDVELYETPTSYAGYEVELYDTSRYYYYGYNGSALRPLTVEDNSDPRDAAFVKLNGTSQATDWQNCESRNNGYLYLSEYDLRLDPKFEVCMRNKGYVLTTEVGYSPTNSIDADSAGLRGYASSTYGLVSGASFP